MRLFQYLSQWKSKAKDGIQQSLLIAKFLCLLHVTNNYVFSPVMVYGPSMLPTLNLTGDVLLVEHLSPLLDKLGPGDVILVRSPDNPRKTVTKRIIGMEGDTVTFLADPSRSDRYISLKELLNENVLGLASLEIGVSQELLNKNVLGISPLEIGVSQELTAGIYDSGGNT
ncbi:hypothetical protein KY285_031448 [Solanum tuberosum]|nr:hypothetical protein KY285_031448 [Solanum tuberosum]